MILKSFLTDYHLRAAMMTANGIKMSGVRSYKWITSGSRHLGNEDGGYKVITYNSWHLHVGVLGNALEGDGVSYGTERC